MRVAGALCVVVGLALTALVLLLPTQLHISGTSADCGVPIVQSFQHGRKGADLGDYQTETNACITQSRHRALAGGVAGVIVVVGGLVMLGTDAGTSREPVRGEHYRAESKDDDE